MKARLWMADWRSHPDCELWALSNSIVSIENSRKITEKEKLELILDNARHALDVLPPDHTIQYMACKYCEAALRLERINEFMDAVHQFENILSDVKSGYWQPADNSHLPWVILQINQLLRAEKPDIPDALSEAFSSELADRNLPSWVQRSWEWCVQHVSAKFEEI